MNAQSPGIEAPAVLDGIGSAEEFNLWCALNKQPYHLIRHRWADGREEWGIEYRMGRPDGTVAYGTGQTNETLAVLSATAFVAGTEWAEVARSGRPSLDMLDVDPGGEETDQEALLARIALLENQLSLMADQLAEAGGEEELPPSPVEEPAETVVEAPEEASMALPPAPPPAVDDDLGDVEAAPTRSSADIDVPPPPLPPLVPAPPAIALPPKTVDAPPPVIPVLLRSASAQASAALPPSPPPAAATMAGEAASPPVPQPMRRPAQAPAPTASLTPELNIPDYLLPSLELLRPPPDDRGPAIDDETMTDNARLLESVLADFGVRGEIVKVRPGPVVTLYELEPAPGTKSARIIGLAEDIARSMSAVAVRIAVVPGRSVIGIELPNPKRQTVYLREMLQSAEYDDSEARLPLVLGKDIGGVPVVVDLARMPHLLIAGTTGSGKSVGINTMILSLLYRMPPDRCRFIMVDPKMLELSVYDGIPHLLAPVVTDPKKAVVALKWAVKEMENRYRAMSQLGVRNIEGFNARINEMLRDGEEATRRVQIGFDPHTGTPIFEDRPIELRTLPYIVVVVDEMADLMLVAGKEIEAAIQRLAQMARAAGIHLIMATQRPSVDVITGTVKANFPSRISFQVTSKIDSRTILGEAGAEQLLGQGDMLSMAGGGRITRVHGPFVSDQEVEAVVSCLKQQGVPTYVDAVTEDEDAPVGDEGEGAGDGGGGDELYDQAVALVARERKASTSFIQRHLQIGYNRAARLVERMEAEGVVGAANHVGRREVLVPRSGGGYGDDDY